MKIYMKPYIHVISIVITTIGAYFFNKLLDSMEPFSNIKIPLWIIYLLLSVSVYITYIVTKIKYVKEKDNIITELKKNKTKYEEKDRLFHMALALDPNENVRYSLFKAAMEKHNVYAGAYMGNRYMCGIEGEISRDYNKAFEYFNSVLDYDDTGIISWLIGWMYEQGYIGSSPNYKMAKEYYEKSLNLGFVKAYNSIGKFYDKGMEVDVDKIKAAYYFSQGAELGDVHAMLNAGFIYEKDKKQLDNAEKTFNKAIKNGSHYAKLRLGKLYMENLDYFKVETQTIANLYIEAITSDNLTEINIALGYYWLACLLKIDSNVNVSKLVPNEIKDAYQYCILQTYNRLFNLKEQEKLDSRTGNEIWEKISDSIIFT